ncbi:ABC transporter ATP-binding protein [Oscillatoria sp. FACHB-1406]|uniref:ABC transporter ATP-binding protein n=1 Tax=Oscillatoria sp. FACHB-1406 TaxID=2692846 RepID=UPI001683DE74|nr:ABC transporter ATP-binding protein [Oscillatoria sp. FACHB-1406]MBD2579645.1 ATP-binding cassette domain-containing protein [Oscillatoria sp. FACHB-1406]
MSASRLLLKFALRSRLLVILTVVLSFSGALFNGIGTALIVPVLLGFLGQDVAFKKAPPALAKILSLFDVFPENTKLLVMLGAVFSLIVFKNVANYAALLVGSYFSKTLVNGMRLEGLKLLLELDLDYYAKNKLGSIVNLLNQEIGRTANAIGIAVGMFTSISTIFVFLILLIGLSWQLTVFTTGLLFIVALINNYYIKRAKSYGKVLSQKSRESTNKLLEILAGMRVIKTVNYEDIEYDRAESLIREREQAELQSQANYAIMGPLNEVLGILLVLSIVVAGRSLFAGRIAIATIGTFLFLLTRLIPVVSNLNGARSKFANAVPSVEIVSDFLRREDKPLMTNGNKLYIKLEQGIHFENLSFAYPGSDDLVLREIDLWIPKGKSVALVGSSGAGKSTVADLVPRFYDPSAGRITFDGIDIREFNIGSLRKGMGIVSQDTFLFNNTIRYNIAYGMDAATDEDVLKAAKRANAYEFISSMPQGFETEIGDRGVMLSGGQRQRLAIARALLRNPDILILDEATSALDTVSERLVQGAIDELCRERTTLVIAHRLSTIQKAHQIAVMDKGRVVEIGTHDELLTKKDGHYARLYNMQFSDRARMTLPSNEALIRASLAASQEIRTRLSYDIRTRLNSMLGSLRLLADDLVDSPEEQKELMEESYDSALQILKTIQSFEEKAPMLPPG